MDLFRKEAIDHQSNRLHGEVTLNTPVYSWVITALMALILIVIALIAGLGSYAHKETVTGWLKPDKGLVRVVSPQLAVVEMVHIAEGDLVKPGMPLVTLSLETTLIGGRTAAETSLQEAIVAIQELDARLLLTHERFVQEKSLLESQLINAEKEIVQLNKQKAIQSERLKASLRRLTQLEALEAEDAAATIEVDSQRETYLSLIQLSEQLAQQIIVKRGDANTLTARLAGIPVNEKTELSQLREALTQAKRQKTQLERQGKTVLTAPVGGRIAALPVSIGESVAPQDLQVSILPEGGKLEAELFVPTRAAGFIRAGQDVRVQFDAFPSQKYGSAEGKVHKISKTVFTNTELPITLSTEDPVYRITVNIDRQMIDAQGEEFPLQAGMTVQADIIQKKQRLWELIFNPVKS